MTGSHPEKETPMADYISTYTGIHFYPAQPDAEGICIEDIAHALSYLCRGNGHVSKYWSVAQHCILCAREAAAREWPDRLVLACLLHDASECYLSDVPRPFKGELTGYREHEERLLQMIYVRSQTKKDEWSGRSTTVRSFMT